MSSITSKFLSKFDPKNSVHVLWFKSMCVLAESMGKPAEHLHLIDEVNKNPMGVKLSSGEGLEWVHVHFCLGMKYAKAVVNGDAWVPPSTSYKVTGV